MTASTPRSLPSNPSSWARPSSASISSRSSGGGIANMDEASAHLDRLALEQQHGGPPTLPFDGNDIPDALSLPVLQPRATKQRRHELGETSATLMDFVSHMSIDEARSAYSFSRSSFAEPSSTLFLGRERELFASDRNSARGHDDGGGVTTLRPCSRSSFTFNDPSSTPSLGRERELFASDRNSARGLDDGGVGTSLRSMNSIPQAPSASWSLTTPETVKPMVSTPQARRLGAKRKSPMQSVHSTPVNGNPPLMLPSLNTVNSAVRMPLDTASSSSCSSRSSHCQRTAGGRSMKKAKNYTSLLSSAPMLPSSPDLEDRDRPMAAPLRRYQAQYTTPVGGVTLVNPNFMRRMATSTPVATPQQPPRHPVALPTAGLPSLDESERSAPKWLRMKRRTSLLCALRLAVTET